MTRREPCSHSSTPFTACLKHLCCGPEILALVGLLLPVAIAQSAESGRLTVDELNRLSVQEIEQRLNRNERFTALPSPVKDVLCPSDGSPLFIIGGNDTPSDQPRDYVLDEGQFRVVRFGSVLGASSNEVVLLGSELRRGGVILAERELGIVQNSGVRHLRAPSYPGISQAFKTRSGWGFISGSGVNLGNSTNLNDIDLPSRIMAQVIGDSNERVFVTRPNETLYGAQEGRLLLNLQDAKGELRREQFKETGNLSVAQEGLVHLRDGRWLSIGKRLVVMQTNMPALPPESELKAVLDAAKTGDRNAFSRAAQSATEYAPEQLQGLVQLLQKLPDPLESAGALERNARDALRSRLPEPPAGISNQQRTQMLAIIDRHRKNLEEFLTELDQLRKGSVGVSARLAGSLIQSGYQHFAGWWIGQPRVLKQESLRSILLDMAYLSPTNTPRRGVFRLDQDARLELLGDYGPVIAPGAGEESSLADAGEPFVLRAALDKESRPFGGPCQFVTSDADSVLLFFPLEGLARVGQGKFDWTDRSEPFRRMRRVLGADPQGRIYLASAPALMARSGTASSFRTSNGRWARWAATGGPGDLWIYRASAPMPPSPVVRLFPLVTPPVIDSQKRVWFLPLKPSTSIALPEGVGALGDTPAATRALKDLQSVLGPKATPGTAFPAPFLAASQDRSEWWSDLCCYQAGKLTVAVTNVPYQTLLAAGNNATVLGYTWTGRTPGALLVDQGRVLRGTNLHELAQKFPRELLNAAPARTSTFDPFVPNYDWSADFEQAAITRTVGYLWINQGGTLEVYRDGKPLEVASRLTLLNSPSSLAMQGPLATPAGPAMVLTGRRGTFSGAKLMAVFWATPSTNGIDLVRGPDKDLDPAMEMPLVNPVKGCVYFPRFIAPPRFWVLSPPDKAQEQTDGRVPIMVNGKGELLTRASLASFSGLNVATEQKDVDIPVSYTRNLQVTQETADGKLICRTAEGLAWLERDSAGFYRITRELDLHAGGFALSLVGETERETFVTVVDARQNVYLAVLTRP